MNSRIRHRVSAAAIVTALGAGQMVNMGIAGAVTAVPADILDVDFSTGAPVDNARNLPARQVGTPAVVQDQAVGTGVAQLDGGDDAVQFDLNPDFDQLKNGFSAECTFRFDGSLDGTEKSLCANKEAGGWSFAIYGDRLSFNAHVGGGYKHARHTVEEGRWYHAVGVFDGTDIKLYINGELVASSPAVGEMKAPTGSSPLLTLGGDSNGTGVLQFASEMSLRSAKVYSEPISEADIATLFEESRIGSHEAVELVSSSPAAGDHVTFATPFQVTYSNPDLIGTNVTYTLDGQPITPGETIGRGMTAGDHVISIQATDVFGNTFTQEIPFTSGNIPVEGGTETTQGRGAVSLSAIADNPSGGEVTTTFTRGAATSAQGGFQGVITGLPTTLDFEYTEQSDITDPVIPGDDLSVQAPATTDLPFQRFDITVPTAAADDQQLVWSGTLDPTRTARLFAWNTTQGRWEELSSTNGVAGGTTTLTGAVTADHQDGDTVHALVVGYDPFADNLDEPVDGTFANPDTYDFSIAHHTDTQYLSEGAVEQETAEERALWKETYTSVPQWIADNAEERKIVYSTHTGDIIENWIRASDDEEIARQEFEVASEAQEILEDAGVVNGVTPGNHDNQTGTDNGADSLYNEYFGPERYEAQAQTQAWQDAQASYHPYTEGDNDNHYDLFSASGLDFIALHLGYGVTAEEAAWADSVLKTYSDRNAIVLTHAYNKPSSAPDGRGAAASHDRAVVLDQVVAKNPNAALVLSGHEHGVSIVTRNDVGYEGNHVVELLADYQFYEIGSDELGLTEIGGYGSDTGLRLGSAFFRLLQFDLDAGEMAINTYSPMLDNFGATEYDTNSRYNGTEDELRLPIQFETRKTSFTTDAVTLVGDTGEVIGESTAKSGWPATVTWPGLDAGEVYAWYATSMDASTGEDLSPGQTRQFAVFTANDAGADSTPPELTVPAGTLTVEQGQQVDLLDGVSATDTVDGDLTADIQTISTVDTSEPGAYAITYVVADANGNQSTATRVVIVEAASNDQETPGSSGNPSGSSAGSSSGPFGIFSALGGFFSSIFTALTGLFR